MRHSLRKTLAAVVLAALATPAARADGPKKVRVVLVGDSTVTDTAGWGKAFAALLGPGAECANLARGGASSKSFYDQGHWKKALAEKPAVVLIQFGHNDQPGKGPERETDPKTTYREYLAKYVDEARKAGAEPVLVTSMVRRVFADDGKLKPDLEPYAEAARAVAADRKVPVVDLHARSRELVEKLGPAKAEPLGPPHPKREGKFDGTHLSEKGAAAIAPLVAAELRDAVPALRDHLPDPKKPVPAKP